MKIQVISDIHLEFLKNLDVLNLQNFKKAEYLFLAGDVGIPLENKLWLEFMTWCNTHFSKVFYVLGNHESYGYMFEKTVAFVKESLKTLKNIILLEKGVVYDLENYKIVGCTLWTDIDDISAEYLNDTKMIFTKNVYTPINTTFIKNIYNEDKAWLSQILTELKSDKVIVMTHHLPTKACVDPRFKNSKYEKGFVADVDDLIKNAKCWIFGHTHCHVDFIINETRLYANPLGIFFFTM